MKFLNMKCESKNNNYNKIRTQHFCLKVLSAMWELRMDRNVKALKGIDEKCIINLMLNKYLLDGDVTAQVQISLQNLMRLGLIYNTQPPPNPKYELLGPLAQVINTTENSSKRKCERDRVRKIFWTNLQTVCPDPECSYHLLNCSCHKCQSEESLSSYSCSTAKRSQHFSRTSFNSTKCDECPRNKKCCKSRTRVNKANRRTRRKYTLPNDYSEDYNKNYEC